MIKPQPKKQQPQPKNQQKLPESAVNTSMANNRAILAVFDKYQKDRLNFVQTISDFANRESNVDVLQQANVMALLKPLLVDPVPSIQQAAAVALGRLANYNETVATAVVQSDILPQLVYSLKEQNRFYKKAAAFVIRAIARHTPSLAQAVVQSGAVQALVHCLEEFDPTVKEAASWALGYIARHHGDLAQAVVEAGAIPLLVLALQEPELPLKRIAASALGDISKHSPELAQAVVDAQAVPILSSFIQYQAGRAVVSDLKLQRQAASCLGQIAKHSLALAEMVVDGDIFPSIYHCFKAPDQYLRRTAANLICEIVKHASELAQLVVNTGGVAVVVDFVQSAAMGHRIPGIMTLGYLAAMNELLAMSVIVAKGVPALIQSIESQERLQQQQQSAEQNQNLEDDQKEMSDVFVQAATCWALGQIGRHSPEHAKHLVATGVLPKLLFILKNVSAQEQEGEKSDLRQKAKRAMKAILSNTLDANALEPLLHQSTPPNVLKYVMNQFAKILPNDAPARKAFVVSGSLARVQEIASTYALGSVSSLHQKQVEEEEEKDEQQLYVGLKIAEAIRVVNECFPEEIVRYYSPGYSNTLLAKLDQYKMESEKNQQPEVKQTPKASREQLENVISEPQIEKSAPVAN